MVSEIHLFSMITYIFFVFYQVQMDDLLQNHLFATHAIVAAGSVTLGTAVTYPLDTIKSLIQVSLLSG